MTVKDMVQPGKRVKFIGYRQNELWYETDCGFKFPVPIRDTGTAWFSPDDKAILFMRWIRRYWAETRQADPSSVGGG